MDESNAIQPLEPEVESSVEEIEQDRPFISPTLNQVPKKFRPSAKKCVCLYCPNAIWKFIEDMGLLCYCMVLREYSVTTAEPNKILLCDGIFAGMDNPPSTPSTTEPQNVNDLDGASELSEEDEQ